MSNATALLAARDQLEAASRENHSRLTFDQIAQRVSLVFLAVVAVIAVYGGLAVANVVPAAPWSPLGQARMHEKDREPVMPSTPTHREEPAEEAVNT